MSRPPELEYYEALHALKQQALLLCSMLDEGVRRWAGMTTKAGLYETCHNILNDCRGCADKHGDNHKLEEYRDFARKILQERFPEDFEF